MPYPSGYGCISRLQLTSLLKRLGSLFSSGMTLIAMGIQSVKVLHIDWNKCLRSREHSLEKLGGNSLKQLECGLPNNKVWNFYLTIAT